GNKEKRAAKKLPPREVLLIRGGVLRFSSRKRLRHSVKNAAKKKPSCCLAVRGRWRPRQGMQFQILPQNSPSSSPSLFLLPCFFFPRRKPGCSQADTAW
ncbi:hypothetical protein B296_00057372, partial [Ensete ventricosum]